MEPKFNELEKQFYSDGYRLAIKAANEGFTEDDIFSSIKEMYHSIDEFNSSFAHFTQKHKQKIACKKGCEWCCHQPVFALSYELDYLNDYIKNNFNSKEQKEISIRAAKKCKQFEGLQKDILMNSKFPCPLLKDGICIAYDARPISCRIYLSMDVKTCMTFFKKPNSKTNFPALFSFPLRIGRMMNEGFKAALKENGVLTEEFRIEEKLL